LESLLWDQFLEAKMSEEKTAKYLKEFNKYKNRALYLGKYRLKDNPSIEMEILEFNLNPDLTGEALVKTISSGITRKRTVHWCRKNLV
jgi:hypothetical protein